MKVKTIEEALQRASFYLENAGLENPRVESELLLAHLLETDRLQLFLKKTQNLSSKLEYLFDELVRRRAAGEPTAYIIGSKEFYGFCFNVNKDVLIPRPETELLVDRALPWLNKLKTKGFNNIRVLDLGTGSGILAITIALKVKDVLIDAVDISEGALQIAKHNAVKHRVEDRISWYCGCYFEALNRITPQPRYNLVISNPPYLTKTEMLHLPPYIRDHEPCAALDGGEEGMDGYRIILDDLDRYLMEPSMLLLEAGAAQQKLLDKLCHDKDIFKSITWYHDLAGHARVLEAERQ